MDKRMRMLLAGVAATALLAMAGPAEKLTASPGERSISLYNIHTKETVTAVYKKDGKFVEAGLAKVNHVLRDFRRNEETKMDPELIDLLWEVHHELGSREPIHIISGYRSRATNEQLRRTVGGQASESRHILGKAADVHFPDVPVKNIRYSALIRERGGVGYYPTSAIPFVHIDTDRVRAWPRLPRYELAMLFPSGTTKHAPADGGPITKEDVRVAQVKHRDLWTQIAAFHDDRRNGRSMVALADAGPSTKGAGAQQIAAVGPSLIETPRAVAPPTAKFLPASAQSPSASDRAKLAELAAFASTTPQLVVGPQPARRPSHLSSLTGNTMPATGLVRDASPAPTPKVAALAPASAGDALTDGGRFGWAAGWVQAASYDDEHPDELSYRPFPIAPYLTQSANDPLMSDLIAHDVAKTVDLIDQQGAAVPLRFRPTERVASALWTQQFTGGAVKLMPRDDVPAQASALANRAVRTSQK